ncbi:MAG: hypothetical protein HZC28_09645 [Spirochaetes bacterium]|nr:hypothetical protein [Spirochaetota bacterium]
MKYVFMVFTITFLTTLTGCVTANIKQYSNDENHNKIKKAFLKCYPVNKKIVYPEGKEINTRITEIGEYKYMHIQYPIEYINNNYINILYRFIESENGYTYLGYEIVNTNIDNQENQNQYRTSRLFNIICSLNTNSYNAILCLPNIFEKEKNADQQAARAVK